MENFDQQEDPCKQITRSLLTSANTSIPKSSDTINTKYSNCWWNEDCKIATKNARKQFTNVKRNSTPENVDLYLSLEEIAKETVIEAKKESWNNYVSTITRTTSIKEIWTKINAISGKHSNQNKINLTINNVK